MSIRKLQLFLVSTIIITLSAFQIAPVENEVQWVDITVVDSLKTSHPKPVFIDIRADWCGMCKKFEATTLQDHEVINFLNENFHSVHFDFHDKRTFTFQGVEYADAGKFHALAKHFDATGLPTFVFLDKELNTLEVMQGFRNKKEFLKTLESIIENQQ